MSGRHEEIKRLAREIGADVSDVIALSQDNDPNYIGTPGHTAKAQWFDEQWETRGSKGRGGVHLRRAHYQILGSPKHNGLPYQNTHADWNYLIDASRYACILGLVDPEDIIDRRNPEPHIFLQRPEEEEEIGFELDTDWLSFPELENPIPELRSR